MKLPVHDSLLAEATSMS